MRTVTFKSVLEGVAALMGINPSQFPLEDRASFCSFINRYIVRGWTWDFFPEWTPVERRAYRPFWSAGDTYAAGTEVFFETDELYYSANSAPNNPAVGESPASAPTKWTKLTSFARYVALDQPGLTPIAEVKRVCRNDPTVNPTRAGEVRFDITNLGIVPAPSAGARVYVEFRLQPPVFTTNEWSQATNYVAGDLCYRPNTTGECYRALAANSNQVPEANAATWRKVDMPQLLRSYVERASYADAIRGDGQTDKALAEDNRATTLLLEATDVAMASQGQ